MFGLTLISESAFLYICDELASWNLAHYVGFKNKKKGKPHLTKRSKV